MKNVPRVHLTVPWEVFSNQIEVIQGEAMNQKSLIYVKVDNNNGIINVYVGGKAYIEDYIKI